MARIYKISFIYNMIFNKNLKLQTTLHINSINCINLSSYNFNGQNKSYKKCLKVYNFKDTVI